MWPSGWFSKRDASSDEKCKEVSESLNKVLDFATKWAEHFVSVSIRQTENEVYSKVVENAAKSASYSQDALQRFRTAEAADDLILSDSAFQRILENLSELGCQVRRHQPSCSLDRLMCAEKLSSFKAHIGLLQECITGGGLYTEPLFLPAYSSTPLQQYGRARPLSRTPDTNAI
jgi:hypothetical protein